MKELLSFLAGSAVGAIGFGIFLAFYYGIKERRR